MSRPIIYSNTPDPDAPKPALPPAKAAASVPASVPVTHTLQLTNNETESIIAIVPKDLGPGSAVTLKYSKEYLQVVDASIRDHKLIWNVRWVKTPPGAANPQMIDVVTT